MFMKKHTAILIAGMLTVFGSEARAGHCGSNVNRPTIKCLNNEVGFLTTRVNKTKRDLEKLRSEIPDLAKAALPKGTIVTWFSAEREAPKGWAFCDGKEGRPNLDGKWLVGTGDPDTVGKPIGGGPVILPFSGTANATTTEYKYPVSGQAGDPPHAPGMDHTHTVSGSVSISDTSILAPPSIQVRYIIKN